MTDKEIVVGGIDVSGCKCLRNVKIILELARPEDFELLCGATNGAMKCEQWKDCYYKQLQRKTKECEKKSWEIGNLGYKIKNQRREINERLKQIEKLKCKEQECEKYEQALDEIEKELKEDIYCENQECGCDDFEECLKCTKEHILDIINNAKDINVPSKKDGNNE